MVRRFVFVMAVVSIVLCVFAQQDERKAKSTLKKAIEAKNFDKIKSAVNELTDLNTEKAAKAYMEEFVAYAKKDTKETDIGIYNILLDGIKKFTSKEALTQIANTVIKDKTKPHSYDILDSLLQVNTGDIIEILGTILLQGSSRHKEMVADNFKKRRVKDAIPKLIDGLKALKKEETMAQKAILRALRKITGKDCGSTYEEWKRWWDTQAATFEIPKEEATENKPIRTAIDLRDDIRETIKEIDKEDIVVLTASCYATEKDAVKHDHNLDHIEDTLEKMEIPHIVVTRQEFESDKFSMKGRIALLVNCAHILSICHGPECKAGQAVAGVRAAQCAGPGPHYSRACKLGQEGIDKIRDFVADGGYLFTEDWNIYEIIEKAFPDFIEPNVKLEDAGKLEQAIVDILPAKGATGHPYLKEVFEKVVRKTGSGAEGTTPTGGTETIPIKQKWAIDQDSPGLKVVSDKTFVLIVSEELGKKYPGLETVAVTFSPYGGDILKELGTDPAKMKEGKVLHVISHFSKLERVVGENAEFTLQNLLLNFLEEAIQKHKPKKKK